MQYFKALSEGRKRTDEARKYLNKMTDGAAMPALALSGQEGSSWNPVGQEMLYAFVNETPGFVLTDTSGYVLAIVDAKGYSKAIVQGITDEQKQRLESQLQEDGIPEYRGKVTLPV